MRNYQTTWDLKEVNKWASQGYRLHTAAPVNGLIQYVMVFEPDDVLVTRLLNNDPYWTGGGVGPAT